MRSTFGGLSTSLRALMAQQLAVDVTDNNVANANTAGYSRQAVDFIENDPYTVPALNHPVGAGQIGTGVKVGDINRARDQFVDQQWRVENETLGNATVRQSSLQQIEAIYNEPSDNGLNALMNNFWNSWRDLSNNPESSAQRASLLESSLTLTDAIQHTRGQLVSLQRDLDSQVQLQVTTINDYAKQIAALNDQIVKVEATGDHANDLLDQRDLLLDKLSQVINISYVTNPLGGMTVSVGGEPLVVDNQSFALATQPDPNNNGLAQVISTADGSLVNPRSGSLRGTLDSRDIDAAGQINQLDTLANTLITQVNQAVEQGYSLNNSTGAAVQFFTGTNANDINVSSAVQNDLTLIASAQSQNSPGDGSNALAVANLQSSLVLVGNTTSIGDFYNSMITNLGVATQQQQSLVQNQTLLVNHLTTQRQQTSGVSLDEEAANLVQFQQSYQAAARSITTLDQMLDQVINHMGLVGIG